MVGKTHLAVAIGRQVILAGYTVLFLPTLVTQLAKAHGLVSRRYERRSMLITSNHSIGEWGTVFGDAVVATAILDACSITATSAPSMASDKKALICF